MSGQSWVRLDNASNIFLAARTDADPKVFRMSAELDHDIDPVLLQQALEDTFARFRLYRAVLRSGVFWYYLQESSLTPQVTADEQHTCAAIYRADRRNLLFRVMHHRRRIILEVFHALSDGTGAWWFLSDLVNSYVHARQDAPARTHAPALDVVEARRTASGRELVSDSFAHYFRRQRRLPPAEETRFTTEASDPVEQAADAAHVSAGPAPSPARSRRRKPVYRVGGTRTPDNRTRAVELTMDSREVLALARAEGASLTMYLTALFLESVRSTSGGLGRRRTLAASVPVNLRQFFPSTSARNFFATVRVAHTYGEGADDLGSVARALEQQFRPKATPTALEGKLRRFIRFERSPALRVLPRPVKDVILGLVNWFSNRGLTVAVSNLGRVNFPEPAESLVGRVLFHVSAARPQFCVISHAGLLTVSFTSPFTETDHVREFARVLTSQGIDVQVAATRVTESELEEATP